MTYKCTHNSVYAHIIWSAINVSYCVALTPLLSAVSTGPGYLPAFPAEMHTPQTCRPTSPEAMSVQTRSAPFADSASPGAPAVLSAATLFRGASCGALCRGPAVTVTCGDART